MNTRVNGPKYGTQEYEWWAAGATEEVRLRTEGMTPGGKELWEFVETMGQQGYTARRMVWMVTYCYGPALSFKQRWRLVWGLIRPRSRATREAWMRGKD